MFPPSDENNPPHPPAPADDDVAVAAASSDEKAPQLNLDCIRHIIECFNTVAPIHQAVGLRALNWQVCTWINSVLHKTQSIEIRLFYHEDRAAYPDPQIIIQGTTFRTLEKALQCLDFLLSHMALLTDLSLDVSINRGETVLRPILDALNEKSNVQLKSLHLRRRYVGEAFASIGDLIRRHASTLRVVGRIGLQEAAQACCEALHLERLSLMNFDLVEDGALQSAALHDKTRYFMAQIAASGASFRHLSYTTYTGFDFSKQCVIKFLRAAGVRSLRLTMQTGCPVPRSNQVLLYDLERLELVGNMNVEHEYISCQFPDLRHFDVESKNLIA